jgi:transcriptional regulator with XRE-family HTH domain
MTIGKNVKDALAKGSFAPAKTRITLTPGDAVRIARELQGLTQSQLAEASGLPQSAISGIELGRIVLGLARAKKLAIALRVHPGVLAFPSWNPAELEAAS